MRGAYDKRPDRRARAQYVRQRVLHPLRLAGETEHIVEKERLFPHGTERLVDNAGHLRLVQT